MVDKILQEINELPPLPKTILEIQMITEDPESSLVDLTKVIERDPMIVADLIKTANSPLYAFDKEMKNVNQIVSLFGMTKIRSIIMSYSLRNLLKSDMEPYGVSPDKFAEICLQQANLAACWAKKIKPENEERLFMAALLQENGKIPIANYVVQEDLTTMFKSEVRNSSNISEIEKFYTKTTTAEASAAIFEHWEFDEDLISMIYHSDDPENAPAAVEQESKMLNIIRTALPINASRISGSVSAALAKARMYNLNEEALKECIETL
jgi:HD-like signal output (HDOD) protein